MAAAGGQVPEHVPLKGIQGSPTKLQVTTATWCSAALAQAAAESRKTENV